MKREALCLLAIVVVLAFAPFIAARTPDQRAVDRYIDGVVYQGMTQEECYDLTNCRVFASPLLRVPSGETRSHAMSCPVLHDWSGNPVPTNLAGFNSYIGLGSWWVTVTDTVDGVTVMSTVSNHWWWSVTHTIYVFCVW